VERSRNGHGSSQIGTVGVNVATYSATGLSRGTTYYFGDRSGLWTTAGWELVGPADFKSERSADYMLCKPSTCETAIWYLNNNVFGGGGSGWLPNLFALYRSHSPDRNLVSHDDAYVGFAIGPMLPRGWSVVAP
jgi:hypothetical protein